MLNRTFENSLCNKMEKMNFSKGVLVMDRKPEDRNETSNRVFFGTANIFTVLVVIGFTLYLLYQFFVK